MAKLYRGIHGKAIRENRPLTKAELQHFTPSVFGSDKHESRAERFSPVCTYDILEQIKEESGFVPFFAVQTKVRDKTREDFTKHMLRLRRPEDFNKDLNDEIILLNANDGTSSCQLISGQFRSVCHNGLVMGSVDNNIRVRHSGDATGNVIEGVYTVLKDFDEIHDIEARMRSMKLEKRDKLQFALSAYILKEGMPKDDDYANLEYNPIELLRPLRQEDRGDDLFTIFNVVQEHILGGGQKRKTGVRRTKAITAIPANIQLNRGLWQIAKDALDELTPKQY